MISEITQNPKDVYSGAYCRVDGLICEFDYDLFNDEVVHHVYYKHEDSVRSLTYQNDLFCCTKDGKLLKLNQEVAVYKYDDISCNSITMNSPNTGMLGGENGEVIIFDIRQEKPVHSMFIGNEYISSMYMEHMKAYVASGDGTISFIDLHSYKTISSFSLEASIHSAVPYKNCSIVTATDKGLHYYEKNAKKYSKQNCKWSFYDYVPASKVGELDGAIADNDSVYVYGTNGVFKILSNSEQEQIVTDSYEYLSAMNGIVFGTNFDTISIVQGKIYLEEELKDSEIVSSKTRKKLKQRGQKSAIFIDLD
eukprot:NODE_305_length_11349_cov_0.358222.p4 type:complete len:308 gc:universal NODE_305_length_11349_cov_0.358222:4215-5138(+)